MHGLGGSGSVLGDSVMPGGGFPHFQESYSVHTPTTKMVLFFIPLLPCASFSQRECVLVPVLVFVCFLCFLCVLFFFAFASLWSHPVFCH